MELIRSRTLLLVLLLIADVTVSVAQKVASSAMAYTGIIGQQHVTVSLEVDGESLQGGHYRYDGRASEVHFTDARVVGTTAVLQDEDGNIIHLHMKSVSGDGALEWENVSSLEGTLVRGDLDLPVQLARTAARVQR